MMFERWMAKFLRKRGWVVFYLDEPARFCRDDFCWLRLFEEERIKEEVRELERSIPYSLRRIFKRDLP